MSIAKIHQNVRSIARDASELTIQNKLDSKPADLERHLRRDQEYPCILGQIIDVYRCTRPLIIAQPFFPGYDVDHLQSRQY
jgi:hypothetical protein